MAYHKLIIGWFFREKITGVLDFSIRSYMCPIKQNTMGRVQRRSLVFKRKMCFPGPPSVPGQLPTTIRSFGLNCHGNPNQSGSANGVGSIPSALVNIKKAGRWSHMDPQSILQTSHPFGSIRSMVHHARSKPRQKLSWINQKQSQEKKPGTTQSLRPEKYVYYPPHRDLGGMYIDHLVMTWVPKGGMLFCRGMGGIEPGPFFIAGSSNGFPVHMWVCLKRGYTAVYHGIPIKLPLNRENGD